LAAINLTLAMLILLAAFRKVHVADSGRDRELLSSSPGCRAGELYLLWTQCPMGSIFLRSGLTPVLRAVV